MGKAVRLTPELIIDLDDVDGYQRYQFEEPTLLPIQKTNGEIEQQLRSPYWQYALRLKDGRVMSATGEYVPARKNMVVTTNMIKDLDAVREQLRQFNSPGAQQEKKEWDDFLSELGFLDEK